MLLITYHVFRDCVQIIMHGSGKRAGTGALKGVQSGCRWGQALWKGSDTRHQEPPSAKGRKTPPAEIFAVVFFVMAKPKCNPRALSGEAGFSSQAEYKGAAP